WSESAWLVPPGMNQVLKTTRTATNIAGHIEPALLLDHGLVTLKSSNTALSRCLRLTSSKTKDRYRLRFAPTSRLTIQHQDYWQRHENANFGEGCSPVKKAPDRRFRRF